MFCPKCGSLIEDNATHCAICGEEVAVQEKSAADTDVQSDYFGEDTSGYATPAPVKKRKKPLPKWLLPAAIGLGVLVIALILFFVITSSPKTTVKSALSGFDDAILENELFDSMFSTLEEFHMFADIQQIYGPEGQEGLTEPIKLDIYSDGSQGSVIVDVMGAQFDIHALTDPMTLVVGAGDKAYGVVLEGLQEAFKKSVFHPDSDSKYALDMNEEELAELEEILASYEEMLTEGGYDELTEYFNDYGDLLLDLMWEYGEIESEKEDGNRVVTITLDEKSTAKILKDFIKELCSDEDLIAYLDENVPMESLAETGLFTADSSWEDVMEMLEEYSGEMISAVKSLDFKLAISVTASPVAHNLKGVEVKLTVDGGSEKAGSVSVKAGIAFEGNDITISVSAPGSKSVLALEETEEGWVVYAKSAGQKMFEAEYKESDEGWSFVVETMGETLLDVELEKKDESYTFNVAVYDPDSYSYYESDSDSDAPTFALSLEGEYVEEKGGYSFTVEELSVSQDGWTQTIEMDARFGYYTDFDMPEVPAYENLLEADEETIDELIETFTALFEGAFGGMMGEAAPDYEY